MVGEPAIPELYPVSLNCYAIFARTCYEYGFRVCPNQNNGKPPKT